VKLNKKKTLNGLGYLAGGNPRQGSLSASSINRLMDDFCMGFPAMDAQILFLQYLLYVIVSTFFSLFLFF
jgi:hypothetical protein